MDLMILVIKMFIKLFNEDVLKLLQRLKNESVDLIITDPPYGINIDCGSSGRGEYKDRVYGRGMTNDNPIDANNLFKRYIIEFERVLKPNSDCYIFTRFDVYPYWYLYTKKLCKELSVKNCIIWIKNNQGMGDLEANWCLAYEMIMYLKKGRRKLKERKLNIIDAYFYGNFERTIHPTEKIKEILLPLLIQSSDEGDVVLDTFMGTGSVGKVCLENNRSFIGGEIEKKWFDITTSWFNGKKNSKNNFQ